MYTEFDAGGLILLTVNSDGSASGRFLPDYGAPGMLTWLLARDGSWAYQTLAAGSPTRDQLGITITPDDANHQIWIGR